MQKFKPYYLIILGLLSILTTGIGLLAYTGPGNRTNIPGNAVIVLVCDSTQYTGGPVVWRYRDWLGLSAPAGSAQALSWMAAYENVDDPATPICTAGRQGVYVWQLVTGAPVSYPAATVTGSFTCSLAGTNDWCRNATLGFTASEPIPGQKITAIESDRYGNLCSINAVNGSCSWSPTEGNNSMDFWAVSSFGDTSLKQSAAWMLDRTAPALSILVPAADGHNGWFISAPTLSLSANDSISGISSADFNSGGTSKVISTDGVTLVDAAATDMAGNSTNTSVTIKLDTGLPLVSVPLSPNGANGWYTTRPILAASASDSVSGVASALISLNGSAWLPSVSPADGMLSVVGRATDQAGNEATTTTQTVKVDTVPPAVSTAENGTLSNGWYNTDVVISATASDATSGVAGIEYRVDGGTWTAGNTLTLTSDGNHAIDFRAMDYAGNVSTTTRSIKVDRTLPLVSFADPVGIVGQNGWYISPVAVTINRADATSGLATQEYRLNQGAWTPITTSLALTEGVNMIDAQVTDQAGNQATISTTINIDLTPPQLDILVAEVAGSFGWYNTPVTLTGNASDQGSRVAEVAYRIDQSIWQIGKVVGLSADGPHIVDFRATDAAGLVTMASYSLKIDHTPPISAFTNPPEGSQDTRVNGTFTFSGGSRDGMAGLASAAYSLDGGMKWLPLEMKAGQWAFTWDTTTVSDGAYTILVHADDLAGNRENTARVMVQVGNKKPQMYVQEVWQLGEAGAIRIVQGSVPLKEGSIRIGCPRHKDVLQTYSGDEIPTQLLWDRRCGDGAYAAENGDYLVTVTVCDIFSRCTSDTGLIRILLDSTPTTTWTPSPSPSTTPRAAVLLSKSPTPVQSIPEPRLAPVEPQIAPMIFPWLGWYQAVSMAIALAFAAPAMLDPRPRALHRLEKTIRKVRNGQA